MKRQESIVFLSLGSNLGDKLKNLSDAVQLINNFDQTRVDLQSKIYQTSAWGKTDQPDFLNMAISIRTFLEPEMLMQLIISSEEKLGRVRQEHWGPRIIDIDILFYGNIQRNGTNLIIPHPQLEKRKFVLVPLNDIASKIVHPILKKTVSELLSSCADDLRVEEVKILDLKNERQV